jgi:hypothetical protein
MEILIACVLIVTFISVYHLIVYIRKTDKLQKALEEIVANTQKELKKP